MLSFVTTSRVLGLFSTLIRSTFTGLCLLAVSCYTPHIGVAAIAAYTYTILLRVTTIGRLLVVRFGRFFPRRCCSSWLVIPVPYITKFAAGNAYAQYRQDARRTGSIS